MSLAAALAEASTAAARPGLCQAEVTAWRDGQARPRPDWLAEEVPVALVFNGISHAVMLASPLDLDDFALGFGLSEGLLARPDELYGVETVYTPLGGAAPSQDAADPSGSACAAGQPGATTIGIALQLEVASACLARLKDRRRSLAGRTGCGLCGTDSLAQVLRPLPPAKPPTLGPSAVESALRALTLHQPLQLRSGAHHAAAWCSLRGDLLLAREDVGRHNALDKLIGALHQRSSPHRLAEPGFALITSRASVEMVQKAAAVGIGMLVAVSAPTALAVHSAQACGLALAGFARGDQLVAYTRAECFGLPAMA